MHRVFHPGIVCLFNILLVLQCSFTMAEERYSLDDMEITVTSTASGQIKKLPYAPASVTVIPNEALLNRDVVSLADALDGVESISIIGGRKSGNISIRGMDSSATLILVDGKRLNSGFSDKANGMSEGLEVNNMPPVSAIDRIEIIRGPMSAVYGSDALGGVINIITRKSTREWSGAVGAGATWQEKDESGDSYQGDVYLSGPLWRDVLNAQIWGFKKYHLEDRIMNGFRQSDRQSISTALTLTPNARDEINLRFGHIDQNMDSTEGMSSDISQSVDYDFDTQSAGYKGAFSRYNLEANFYRHKTERTGTNETWYPETENYVVDGKLLIPLAEHYLTTGFQWKQDETSTAAGYKSTDNSFGRSSKMWERSFFGEFEYAATQALSLTLGLRVQQNEYYGAHYTLRGYGVYKLGGNWSLKGGYAGGYKNPTLRETDPDIGNPQSWKNPVAYTYGNPDLKPEESDSFEAGMYYAPRNQVSFNATFFDTEYKNKIINTGRTQFYDENNELITDAEGKIWGTYLNIGEATVRGLEFAVEYIPVLEVTLRGNYTFTDSKMDASNALVTASNGDVIIDWRFLDGKPLVGTPKNKINLNGDWRIVPKLSVNASMEWHDSESNVNWSRTISNASDFKIWDSNLLTIDIGAACQVTRNIQLLFKAYNVLDRVRPADDAYTYLEEGRRYWLGTRVSF